MKIGMKSLCGLRNERNYNKTVIQLLVQPYSIEFQAMSMFQAFCTECIHIFSPEARR